MFLDLHTSWRWVVCFTVLPLYTRGKNSRAGPDDMEKWKFLTLPGLELRSVCHPARTQSLYRLSYRDSSQFTMYMLLPGCSCSTICCLQFMCCYLTTQLYTLPHFSGNRTSGSLLAGLLISESIYGVRAATLVISTLGTFSAPLFPFTWSPKPYHHP
jgi:hypothetical protein